MVIWKYGLGIANKQSVYMPIAAKILSAQIQYGVLQIWALCDENAEKEKRTFVIYHTGTPIHEPMAAYIDTVQDIDDVVQHIFELV